MSLINPSHLSPPPDPALSPPAASYSAALVVSAAERYVDMLRVCFFFFFWAETLSRRRLAAGGGGGGGGEPSLAAGPSDGCQSVEGLAASTFSPRTRAAPLIGTFTYQSARGGGCGEQGLSGSIAQPRPLTTPSHPPHTHTLHPLPHLSGRAGLWK